ncbi:hypothetical protein FFF34_001790 [Inquilinus sp. KBS0705]|nr:hypothetical protein FFF34_001790 [Inquilinus sp. KBS0705]
MNTFLFDTVGLTDEHIDEFDATCRELKDNYRVEIPGDIDFQLEQFEAFRHYQNINIRDVFALKKLCGDSYMLFLEMDVKAGNHKVPITHHYYQPWALTYLKHDFGRVLIRHETLVDKVLEVIHPIELDFKEDRPFSRRFYVLTDDRHKAETAMTQEFRDAVMAIKDNDIVIEIIEHTLIIGNRKPIAPKHACYLAEFVARVSAIK